MNAADKQAAHFAYLDSDAFRNRAGAIGVLAMVAGECYVYASGGGCHYFIPNESAGRDEGGWLVGRSVKHASHLDQPVRAAVANSVEKRSFRCYSVARDIPAVVKAAFGA